MMYYCDNCGKVRGFPIGNKTEKSHQCDFCDRIITKCNIGTYATLVGLERNPDSFHTEKESIKVHQMLNLPSNLPVTKIHPEFPKRHLSQNFIVTFPATQQKDGLASIYVTNRETGEQICIQM